MKLIKNSFLSTSLRMDWCQYVPTEPLSHHYNPMVTEVVPIERVNPPIETHQPIEMGVNSQVGTIDLTEVVENKFIEEARLSFVDENAITKEAQNTCQEFTMEWVSESSLLSN